MLDESLLKNDAYSIKTPESNVNDDKPTIKMSNNKLLLIITIFFACFVVSEIIGALASGSLSLLGDAAAMSVIFA